MISVLVVSANNYYKAGRVRDLVKRAFNDVSVWSMTRNSLPSVYRSYDLVILDAHLGDLFNPTELSSTIFWSDVKKIDEDLENHLLSVVVGRFGRTVLWEFEHESIRALIERVKEAFVDPTMAYDARIRQFREDVQCLNAGEVDARLSAKFPEFDNIPYHEETNKRIRNVEMKGMRAMEPMKKLYHGATLEKYIESGEKTILFFKGNDELKVKVVLERRMSDTKLSRDQLVILGAIKAYCKTCGEQAKWRFFSDYAYIQPTRSQNPERFLRDFCKAMCPKGFYDRYHKEAMRFFHQMPSKEREKKLIIQKQKEKKKNG